MIDHFNLPVTDLRRSREFYEQILRPLGYHFLMQDGDAMGFGTRSWGFGIVRATSPFPRLHIAFRAARRSEVDRFFAAALLAGGRSNGDPGIRPRYDQSYYAAFVYDPDEHNVEAVCRTPD